MNLIALRIIRSKWRGAAPPVALTVALAVVCLLACTLAQAQLPQGWTSVRALGMGNAYTAVVSDSDSIFYNPAALIKVKGVNWTVMDPRIGADNVTNANLIKSLSNTSNIANTVNSLYGDQLFAGGGAKSAIAFPYFGAAAYVNTEANIAVSNPPDPSALINYFFDYGAALSAAVEPAPGFGLGVTARYINRTGTNQTIGAAVISQNNTSQLQNMLEDRGWAVAVDLGAVITAPGPLSPTLSFVYRDMGNTTFSHDQGAQAPQPVQSEMIAGASLTFSGPGLRLTPSIDYRYIGWSNVATGQNINLGCELHLLFIDLRGGLSQGYYTAGAGLNLGLIRLDAATWAEELGAYSGQAVDRRYMVQLTIELGFDPGRFLGNGNGGSGSGSGSHLIQRR